MNKNAKRAVTLLIILTMIIGMFPAMGFAVAGDLAEPRIGELDDGDYTEVYYVQKGDTLVVREGEEGQVGSGSIVAVYWDVIGAWDDTDKEGYMNETDGSPAGNYEVWLDVPEGVYGEHYVWVKNLDSGDYAFAEVFVQPKVKVSPGSGLEDDRVTVSAYGLKKDKETAILFSGEEYFYDLYQLDCLEKSDDHDDETADEYEADTEYTPIKPGSVHIELTTYQSGYGTSIEDTDKDGKLYYVGTSEKVGDINYINGEYEFEVDSGTGYTIYYCVFDDVLDPDVWMLEKGGDTDDVGKGK
jgi:hypothetical protein